MKKLLLLLTCITGLLHAVPYKQLSSDLKEQLCAVHLKPIGHQDYKAFFKQYATEAQQTLTIIREISKTTDVNDHHTSLIQTYFHDLGSLHGYIFDNLIKPSRLAERSIQSYSSLLLQSIRDLKEAFNLDIDPELELKNTIDLLQKANEHFIQKALFHPLKLIKQRLIKRNTRRFNSMPGLVANKLNLFKNRPTFVA